MPADLWGIWLRRDRYLHRSRRIAKNLDFKKRVNEISCTGILALPTLAGTSAEVVEASGIEPLTYCVQSSRSPS